MNRQEMRHYLSSLRKRLRPHYKELRFWRLGNEDAFWLEREHELYRKFEKRYSETINLGVPENTRKSSDVIWTCWLQGMEDAPAIVRACCHSLQEQLPDKKIIVLSSTNILDYINIPYIIINKFNNGIITPAHFSDLIRINLLCNYGGMWVDSTVLLTGDALPRYAMSLPLFVFKQINISNKDIAPIVGSNWCLSAQSNSQILSLTQKLLWEYWESNNHLEHYFIFHIFFAIACRRYPQEWANVPTVNNVTPHELMFQLGDSFDRCRWERICRASDIHKLTHHVEYGRGTFYRYILDRWGDCSGRNCL